MGRVDAARRKAEAAAAGEVRIAPPEAVAAERTVAETATAPLPPAEPEHTTSNMHVEDLSLTVARKVVIDDQMLPAAREQYRRLAAALHQAQIASAIKVVMIASAVPAEGKTLTAANLALTLSESYHRRVLLVDADLRRPSLHDIMNIKGAPGLTEILTASEDHTLPLHHVSSRLSVLPAGVATLDPMAALASQRMRHILDEARELFDWIIVDTPPVGLLSDANLVAANVDGVVFVVKAGSTPYDLVKRGLEALGPERLLGVVLNRAVASAHRYGYGYQHYSAYTSNSKRKGK
jgi:receptor protein-tyrosine kinase